VRSRLRDERLIATADFLTATGGVMLRLEIAMNCVLLELREILNAVLLRLEIWESVRWE